jgi:hypothetical protein
MAYTVLHISDLHRARTDPIGNAELLSTLLVDVGRFASEDPPIASPDAIVVSGDLIHGAQLGTPDYEEVLSEQYDVAGEFLERLADEFLAGDRSKVVVVPGNHDVDWNVAFASMARVDERDVPPDFSPLLCGPTEGLRWDWRERCVYRIINRAMYGDRLAQFCALLENFYDGADVFVGSDFRVHSLLNGRIAVVAFNSCVGNDCFAFHGAIDEDALAQAHMRVRTRGYELLAAVWHHSIDGDPYATDYMAVATVQRMIGKGFRLGLHGHQHRAAASLRYVHLPEEERIAVVSAGSLCAGRFGLPVGVNRQYNVLELSDDLTSVRVHVREMAIATNFAPARRAEFGLKSYVDLDWSLPEDAQRAARNRTDATVLKAEEALRAGHHAEATSLLQDVARPIGSYARRLAIGALEAQKKWDELVQEIGEPQTIEELTAAAMAMAGRGDVGAAEALIDAHAERLQLADASKSDLARAARAAEAMR